ncbi:MAG: hypothetical protein KC983_09765, partial [Phycisphaerales bacterium]|nr:hypothetical protein [Phycisphaerales bacterium]
KLPAHSTVALESVGKGVNLKNHETTAARLALLAHISLMVAAILMVVLHRYPTYLLNALGDGVLVMILVAKSRDRR